MADFIPVIVGTDLNAYHMGASFHEGYHMKPYLIGQGKLGFTNYSSIFQQMKLVDGLSSSRDVFVPALIDYAKEIDPGATPLLLVGTNDTYVRLIIENQAELAPYYRFRVLPEELREKLQDKEQFYQLAAEHGLPIPETNVYQIGEPFDLEIKHFPIIVKPDDSAAYNAHHFPGRQKLYRLNSVDEIKETIDTIAAGGYNGKLLLQEYLPGDDTYNWDSVLYLDGDSDCQFVSLGQVALQEHSATAVGNYTAIVSRYDEVLMTTLKDFLEAIHYVGYANVDLRYDERTDTLKVLEVNIRQGRSSYYVTQMGLNLTTPLVDDVIYHRKHDCQYLQGENLFSVVPKGILDDYVTNPDIHAEVMRLIRAKKWGNPLFYKHDHHPLRPLYLAVHQYRYRKKYQNGYW